MALQRSLIRFPGYVGIAIVGLYGLTGCAGVPTSSEGAADMAMEAPMDASTDEGAPATAAEIVSPAPSTPVTQTAQPHLIKRANLSLTVDSVDDALNQVSSILRQQRGDILDLQDHQPEAGRHRSAHLNVRVPQANLEATLTALAELGTVNQRSITAEDVSHQLVDLQARLRNLRKSEEALQKIMERSGSIEEVLEVSRELSTVRQQIEQLAAQLKSLQTQVSYSTVELNIAAAVTTVDQPRPLGKKVGETWQNATQSVGSLTVGLLQIGLWLLAYSPYLAVIAIASVVGIRAMRQSGTES
ncbi:MAG: DUF4349 domain-containing protein [Cyanobacteria bacterium J06635_1]